MNLYIILVLLLWSVLGLLKNAHAACPDPADPSEPGKPSLPSESCVAFARPEWTTQERWVWQQVCEGQVADFNKAEGNRVKLDPKKPGIWTEERILRPAFLETILLYEPWREKIPRQGIRISGAWFNESLNLSKAEVKHALVLHCSRFDQDVILLSLHTTRVLQLDESNIAGNLIMSGMRAEDSLFLRFAQLTHVRLRGAHIGERLELSGSTITSKLGMDSLEVGGSLMMNNAQLAKVRLGEAYVGEQLSLLDTTITSTFLIQATSIKSDLLMGASHEHCSEHGVRFTDILFSRVHIGGRFDLSCSTVIGMFKITSAEVRETLDLSGALLPDLNLTGSHIGGALRLARNGYVVQWHPKSTLILQNVTAGAIQDTFNAWPDQLILDGFTYGRFGDFASDGTRDARNWRNSKWLIEWLAKQPEYSPQPYEYLAKVLREGGRQEAAKEILYASKEIERSKACRSKNPKKPDACDLSVWPWTWLSMQRSFIGYGYYPFRAFYWVIGAIALGAFFLKVTSQDKKHNMKYWGLSYSFAMLLPIIDLYRYRTNKVDLEGFARVYFYFHHIFGYILAIFLVAGFSGLLK